jgi:hypothetical protein
MNDGSGVEFARGHIYSKGRLQNSELAVLPEMLIEGDHF